MTIGSVVSIPAAHAETNTTTNPLKAKTYGYSSSYGGRCIPTINASANHMGEDLTADNESPIYAISDGTITDIKQPSGSTTPGRIVIKHRIDNTDYYSVYLHMWRPSEFVKVGQKVVKGQKIATVGSSGPSTGPHLHLEIWKNNYWTGQLVDPTEFLRQHGTDIKAQAKTIRVRTVPSSCTYYNTENTVLYSTPSTTSQQLLKVDKGTKLLSNPTVDAQSGSFLRITVGNNTGWMLRSYITPNFVAAAPVVPPVKPTPPPVSPYKTVPKNVSYRTLASVNFRKGPSTNDGIIQLLSKNTTLTTTGRAYGTWTEVKKGNTTGWVSNGYITKK